MSLRICFTDATKIDFFSSLFQNMRPFSEHVNINFNSNEMYIQMMDTGKVSILEIRIPSNWFTSYSCPSNVTLGIHPHTLFLILHARDKTTNSITMTYLDENNETLFIEMKSESSFDRNFELPLMELEVEIMTIPDVEYEVEIGMPSTTFASLITHLKNFGETLEFLCNENKVELCSKSQELGKMSVVVGMDDLEFFSINEECEMSVSYSMKHLQLFSSYSRMFKQIEIRINNEQPIRMDYCNDTVSVKYYLAPKISE